MGYKKPTFVKQNIDSIQQEKYLTPNVAVVAVVAVAVRIVDSDKQESEIVP